MTPLAKFCLTLAIYALGAGASVVFALTDDHRKWDALAILMRRGDRPMTRPVYLSD
jgi:hypothetical protein